MTAAFDGAHVYGHVGPGVLAVMMAIVMWASRALPRYFQDANAEAAQAESFGKVKDPRRNFLQLESTCRIIFAVVGASVEPISALQSETPHLLGAAKSQHFAIYLVVGVAALVQRLSTTKPALKAYRFLPGFLFWLIGVVLLNHVTPGENEYVGTAHIVLGYLHMAVGALELVETYWPRWGEVRTARAYFYLLVGVWWCHLGLYVFAAHDKESAEELPHHLLFPTLALYVASCAVTFVTASAIVAPSGDHYGYHQAAQVDEDEEESSSSV